MCVGGGVTCSVTCGIFLPLLGLWFSFTVKYSAAGSLLISVASRKGTSYIINYTCFSICSSNIVAAALYVEMWTH